jgi:hypothetical protein
MSPYACTIARPIKNNFEELTRDVKTMQLRTASSFTIDDSPFTVISVH